MQTQVDINLVKQIAREAASQSVKETLTAIGFDMDDPIEIQKDIAAIRDWRHTSEKIKSKTLMGALSLAALGVLALIIVALKAKLGLFN